MNVRVVGGRLVLACLRLSLFRHAFHVDELCPIYAFRKKKKRNYVSSNLRINWRYSCGLTDVNIGGNICIRQYRIRGQHTIDSHIVFCPACTWSFFDGTYSAF
ncbi:hypothetical protein BDZ91DRAFT_21346 [Kalaharituber pfeilii]|nr:hypothetical protein BDZ91DRAFT_21346 [Kalaharituber pfeilii]